jgi:hypothetical protein
MIIVCKPKHPSNIYELNEVCGFEKVTFVKFGLNLTPISSTSSIGRTSSNKISVKGTPRN